MEDLDERGRALENEYFRRKEEELIRKMKAKIVSGDASRTGMRCPKCDGALHETNYENIKIDVCDGCSGVWLDAGELAQITHNETDGGGFFGRMFG